MRYPVLVFIIAFHLGAGCETAPVQPVPPQAATIPAAADWIDCGAFMNAGAEGAWDHILWGGFALAAVKKDGVYFLYYQGSRFFDEAGQTVAWRSIGVATSHDGIRFVKHAANPVLTWFPRGNLEEGAVSSGVFKDAAGTVVMAYGANTWTGGQLVSADGRLALSQDGFSFRDVGIVLDHKADIWGRGDEIFPVIAIEEGAVRAFYYLPNGGLARRTLGVAWTDTSMTLRSAAATSSGKSITAWGPASAVRLDADSYAIFLTVAPGQENRYVEVRTVSLQRPDLLSEPVQVYRFDNMAAGVVLHDPDAGKWFLFYRAADFSGYGVRIVNASSSSRPAASPSC